MPRDLVRCVALLLAALVAAGKFGAGEAVPPAGTCFAVTPREDAAIPTPSQCAGVPAGYADRALWLRVPVVRAAARGALALVVGATRFERLEVRFVYADGTVVKQEVRRGAFGERWRLGAQIGFEPPPRPVPLAAVWLRFDRLASWDLVRLRLLPFDRAERQRELLALLLGGALALLAVGGLYNLGLAVAVRRRFFLWHGLWAVTVLLWGLIWSQLPLALLPGLAGTPTSRLATLLACAAVLFATLSAVSALGEALAPRVRRSVRALGGMVLLLGIVADLPGVALDLVGALLMAATMATLLAVAACLAVAWRRGHAEARDLALAWAVPMATLGLTQVVDLAAGLFGGGAQVAVLFASALQTLALSLLATRRLSRLRRERDSAVSARVALTELADRDPLTGLLNRRGFVDRCGAAFGALDDTPFGLLLIDVDQFKAVNDRYGHEAGDAVLVAIAATLRSFEDRFACLAGRLGGEEFVLGVSGLAGAMLARLAEEVRRALAECDHGELLRQRRVTASIGVAVGAGSGPFRALYGRADRALYEAKRDGRDRVVVEPFAPADPDSQLALPLASGA